MGEFSLRWLELIIDVSLKAVLLAVVTGLLLAVTRIRNSTWKHAAWLGVLVALLGLPLLSPVIPAIPIPWPVKVTPTNNPAVGESTRTTPTIASMPVLPITPAENPLDVSVSQLASIPSIESERELPRISTFESPPIQDVATSNVTVEESTTGSSGAGETNVSGLSWRRLETGVPGSRAVCGHCSIIASSSRRISVHSAR